MTSNPSSSRATDSSGLGYQSRTLHVFVPRQRCPSGGRCPAPRPDTASASRGQRRHTRSSARRDAGGRSCAAGRIPGRSLTTSYAVTPCWRSRISSRCSGAAACSWIRNLQTDCMFAGGRVTRTPVRCARVGRPRAAPPGRSVTATGARLTADGPSRTPSRARAIPMRPFSPLTARLVCGSESP